MVAEHPAIVQQHPNHAKERMLTQYACYYYGCDRIRHTVEQLDQFVIVARQHDCLTIADYFEQLADRAYREEQQREREDEAEYREHVKHLSNDYYR